MRKPETGNFVVDIASVNLHGVFSKLGKERDIKTDQINDLTSSRICLQKE